MLDLGRLMLRNQTLLRSERSFAAGQKATGPDTISPLRVRNGFPNRYPRGQPRRPHRVIDSGANSTRVDLSSPVAASGAPRNLALCLPPCRLAVARPPG